MYIIKNKAEQFFAGQSIDEEGHAEAIWTLDKSDNSVRVFARKDAAEKAAEFFGGKVIND